MLIYCYSLVLALYRYYLISLTNPLNMSSTGLSTPCVVLLEANKQSSHLHHQRTCQQGTQLHSAPCVNYKAKKSVMKQRPATFTARLLHGKHTRKTSSNNENSAKKRAGVGLALAVRRKRINSRDKRLHLQSFIYIPSHDYHPCISPSVKRAL